MKVICGCCCLQTHPLAWSLISHLVTNLERKKTCSQMCVCNEAKFLEWRMDLILCCPCSTQTTLHLESAPLPMSTYCIFIAHLFDTLMYWWRVFVSCHTQNRGLDFRGRSVVEGNIYTRTFVCTKCFRQPISLPTTRNNEMVVRVTTVKCLKSRPEVDRLRWGLIWNVAWRIFTLVK